MVQSLGVFASYIDARMRVTVLSTLGRRRLPSLTCRKRRGSSTGPGLHAAGDSLGANGDGLWLHSMDSAGRLQGNSPGL